MQTATHHIEVLSGTDATDEAALDALGVDGWVLVAVVWDGTDTKAFLRKPGTVISES